MEEKERKLKLYHDQCMELFKSYEGKNLVGKLSRNRQDIRDAFIKKIKELLLKMAELDENSSYVENIRRKLSGLKLI